MNIAAFINANGEVADFYEEGRICLFEKASESWSRASEIPLSITPSMRLSEIKTALRETVAQLQGCEVFLLRDLRGLPRVILEEQGFRVWKSEGPLKDQLENVLLREQDRSADVAPTATVPGPELVGDTADDCYRVDLIELLQTGAPHVSHEILMPFFETVAFRRLEIVCDHIPRWFSSELAQLGLRMESQTPNSAGAGMQVVVVPQCGTRSCPPGRRRKGFSCDCGG
jgi:Fe-only nitrogenase accessory protein AnfO